jgi:hypothetical protein
LGRRRSSSVKVGKRVLERQQVWIYHSAKLDPYSNVRNGSRADRRLRRLRADGLLTARISR